jgi:hypothetical protein
MSYTLHVKTLSGLVLPVEIPMDASMETIRSLVFYSLPDDLQPFHPIQLTLLSEEQEEQEEQEQEQEQEQEESDGKEEQKQEQATAFLLIQPNRFELRIDIVGDSFTVCRPCGVLHCYDRYRFDVIHRDDTSFHLTGVFYIKMGSDDLELFPRVEGHVRVVQPADEWGEEERIQVTDCFSPVPLSSFFPLFGEVSPAFSAFLQEQFLEEWETIVHPRHGGCKDGAACYRCNPYLQEEEDEDEDEDEEEQEDEEQDDSYDP